MTTAPVLVAAGLERPRSDAGFSVVVVTATILVMLILGLSLVALVSENSGLATHHVWSNRAFYAAQAGLEYGISKLAANGSWTGLPSPGRSLGAASFSVAPDSLDENGVALPAGQKRLVSTGVSGEATRVVQAVVSSGGISTYAGTGGAGWTGDGGPAVAAQLKHPSGMTIGPDGSIYFADTDNHVIRKISPVTGVITTVAGSGNPGWTGDGTPATAARLSFPEGVKVAANGDIYIADTGNHSVRKVTAATGIITTIAGSGSPGSSGDGGLATAAKLKSPTGLAVASNGDVYIADTVNNKIRRVLALTGIITTFAGTGTAGYSGDGGLALAARLSGPGDVALGANGDLYIADTSNNAIRRVNALTTIIGTIAGTGTAGYSGDGGAATAAKFTAPEAMTIASTGEVYVADTGNNVVRRFTVGGSIATVAGNGTAGFSGDGGSPTAARLNAPSGVAVETSGIFYIGDFSNNRIRRVGGGFSVVAWAEPR